MTIENARALQEQLANEAIAHLQENGSEELADDCIRSIAVVGKAWGIPADETAHWQARAQQEQTQHVSRQLHPLRTRCIKSECSYSLSNAIRTLAMVRPTGLEPARSRNGT